MRKLGALTLSLMLLSPMVLAKGKRATFTGVPKTEGIKTDIKFDKCEVDYKIVSRRGNYKKVKVKKFRLINSERQITFDLKMSRKIRKAKFKEYAGYGDAVFENRIFKIDGNTPSYIKGLDKLMTMGLTVSANVYKNEVDYVDLNLGEAGFRVTCSKPMQSLGLTPIFGIVQNNEQEDNSLSSNQ